MPGRPDVPMPLSIRAKIFAPFSALNGLEDALRSKEKIHVPKVTLTESALEELDWKLKNARVGKIVSVTYYHLDRYKKGEYLKVTGKLSGIDLIRRTLTVVNTTIPLEHIRDFLCEQDNMI